MIEKLKINGFKSIYDEEIHLGNINVFIGANGCGKSNILEALGVISAAAFGRVDDESLLRRGVRPGVPRLYKSSFKGERIFPHITIEVSNGSADYIVSLLNPLDNPRPAWQFKTERLSAGEIKYVSDGVRNKKNLNPELGLAALKLVEMEENDPAALLINLLQNFSIYCPHTPALRGLVTDNQMRIPVGLSGGGLADALQEFLKDAKKIDELKEVRNDIQELIDWILDFDTNTSVNSLLSPSVARPTRVIRFTDRFMREKYNTLTAYDASEGALYVLFIAMLSLSHKGPKCFAVDNLDQSLNPRLVQKLVRYLCHWILRESHTKQILCTAHNPAVLDGLDLQDERIRLFSVDRNNKGHTKVSRIEITKELISLNKEKGWPLSRLWMMGHIGGVPRV